MSNAYKKYDANVYAFCADWCYFFSDKLDLWENSRKIRNHEFDGLLKQGYSLKNEEFWDYDYLADGDRFGLSTLYRNMPKKDFTRGKKQGFDALMMYWWTHGYTIDEEKWEEYRTRLEESGE